MSDILADGQTGDGQGGVAPSGGQPQSTHVQQGGGQSQGDGGGQVYDFTSNPDSLIRVPGEKEPVKYSEYIKRFVPKADYTKATQEAAKLRQQAQQAQRPAQQPQQRQQQPVTNPFDQIAKDLAAKPYVSGQEAADMMRQMWDGGITNLAKAIGQRDQIITALYQRLQKVDQTVGTLNGRTVESDFKNRLSQVKSELNLPNDPDMDEVLQDIYYSHEGNDLDKEFPNMVKARWAAITRLVRAADKARAENARKQTLTLPTRGGNATPSKPLRQGFQSAKQIADDLFPALQGNQT